MKLNLLSSGAVIVAGLIIAAPVWAQGPPPTGRHYGGFSGNNPNPGFGPMSTEAGGPPPAAMAPPAAPAPPASHHRARRHARASTHAKPASMADMSASQLNQQELGRIQGGAAPPMPPMPGMQPQQ